MKFFTTYIWGSPLLFISEDLKDSPTYIRPTFSWPSRDLDLTFAWPLHELRMTIAISSATHIEMDYCSVDPNDQWSVLTWVSLFDCICTLILTYHIIIQSMQLSFANLEKMPNLAKFQYNGLELQILIY